MDNEYPFPVWGTLGGGHVCKEGDHYIFVASPCENFGIKVGDTMPSSWKHGLYPANALARKEKNHLK